MRLTKIICTLGPASSTFEQIRTLAQKGMSIARINLSHGLREEHERLIHTIREVNRVEGYYIATLLDTKGIAIRTGDVTQPIAVAKDEEVLFSPHIVQEDKKRKVIYVNYDGFASDVRETNVILIDNGELMFDVLKVQGDGSVLARARQSGAIGSRRHVNLPGADIDLPTITEKDWSDIAFAIGEGVDFVALSFVRKAEEVIWVKNAIRKQKGKLEVIAKIETQQAIDALADIVRVADGIMVARGDLGAEIPFERIPVVQDDIVRTCRDAGKPVIVATHMLESMILHPMPTRAEVTDIAHAATTMADATMLSGETSVGRHPSEAIEAMDRVLRETEKFLARFPEEHEGAIRDERDARADAAVDLAHTLHAPAIIVFTRSGRTARALSKFRPRQPIFAFTPLPFVERHLQLSFGVFPFLLAFKSDPEENIAEAIMLLRQKNLLTHGESIVVVSDTRGAEGHVRTVQVRPC